jgi:hypothetical protein
MPGTDPLSLAEEATAVARDLLKQNERMAEASETIGRSMLHLGEIFLRLDEELRTSPVDLNRVRQLVRSAGVTPAQVELCRSALAVLHEQNRKG